MNGEVRLEKELAILRLMYAVSLRLGDEMRHASGCRLDQHQLLGFAHVSRHPGLNQAQLAEQLGRSAVQISRLIDDLEDLGLVERRPARWDRRSKDVYPTDKGKATYARMREHSLDLAAGIFAGTPDDQLDVLSRHAGRIADRLGVSVPDGMDFEP